MPFLSLESHRHDSPATGLVETGRALGEEPPRSHALERLVDALAATGLPVDQLRELQLKALSRMTTATRYPDGDEAPVDLFDARDCEQALAIARSVLASVREQLQPPDGPG